MPRENTAWRAEAFYGTLFLAVLVLSGVGVVVWHRQTQGPTPVGERVSVRERMEVDGAPYLLWSNGQITPDMAAHRGYLLRTIAAQALLESQAAEKSRGR